MRTLISLTIGTMILAASPAQAMPELDGEAKLAKAVEGRIAGEPVDCVNLRNVRSSTVIEGTAIVYKAGGTLYVNRPRAGAEDLNKWDTLVTRTPTNRLCSIDVIQMYDLHARMQTGLVFLGEFVPYRKVANRD